MPPHRGLTEREHYRGRAHQLLSPKWSSGPPKWGCPHVVQGAHSPPIRRKLRKLSAPVKKWVRCDSGLADADKNVCRTMLRDVIRLTGYIPCPPNRVKPEWIDHIDRFPQRLSAVHTAGIDVRAGSTASFAVRLM